MVDKTKRKNWVTGDTFAMKILEGEFAGRNLIFIKAGLDNFTEENYPLFRVKITQDEKVPRNIYEINELEYIKMVAKPNIKNQYDRCSDDDYVYAELFRLMLSRKNDFSNFIYIGNYNVLPPENEYIPKIIFDIPLVVFKSAEADILTKFAYYNLKRAKIYTEEGKKLAFDQAQIILDAKKEMGFE